MSRVLLVLRSLALLNLITKIESLCLETLWSGRSRTVVELQISGRFYCFIFLLDGFNVRDRRLLGD
jgi:hypothetical protein